MKSPHVALVALVAAVTLTSVAAASPDAAGQRVAITTQAKKSTNVSAFVLVPLQPGALKRDSGKLVSPLTGTRDVVREGQSVSIYDELVTFKGNRGDLVVRYRTEWVDAGNGYAVGSSTWKVVRGTGQYAGATGGGRGGDVNLARGPWSSKAEGFVKVPH